MSGTSTFCLSSFFSSAPFLTGDVSLDGGWYVNGTFFAYLSSFFSSVSFLAGDESREGGWKVSGTHLSFFFSFSSFFEGWLVKGTDFGLVWGSFGGADVAAELLTLIMVVPSCSSGSGSTFGAASF